jgi:ankyrin repeat protein
VASAFGHSEVVEVLAKWRADGADGSGAAEVGETPVEKDEKDYINHKEDLAQQTALILAARRGHLQTVQALLRREANVHLKDKNGLTALMWACKRGHDAIIPLLIASGERNERDGMPQRLATDDQRLATAKIARFQ